MFRENAAAPTQYKVSRSWYNELLMHDSQSLFQADILVLSRTPGHTLVRCRNRTPAIPTRARTEHHVDLEEAIT